MGSSKVIILVALFVATLMLISSDVAARDLAETTNAVNPSEATPANVPVDSSGGELFHRPIYCHRRCCYYGRCRCCRAGEMPNAENPEP